jgi:hypothetical protein
MKAPSIFNEAFGTFRMASMHCLEIAQRFNAGFRLGELPEVPSGTADPRLFGGASFVPEGTLVFLCHDFPSVKTLGYFREHRRTAT